MTVVTTSSAVASVAAPTEKQINRLIQLGYPQVPATRSEASQIITRLLVARDMAPATLSQRSRAGYLGGRDLPGAGIREVSTQISLLEALALWDNAAENDAAAINLAVETMVARIRERFCRMQTITVTAPAGAEDAPM